jgi:RNA recognition motif-containing protein
MGTKLYVGNLSFNTTETDLQDLFAQAGAVQDVMLMQDKFTGKSRGFAFVTMTNEQDAQNAIQQFNGKTVEGRALTVNEARPREARPQGGGGYGGGGGGGGRGGGGGGYGRGGGGGGYGGGGGGYGRGDRGSR